MDEPSLRIDLIRRIEHLSQDQLHEVLRLINQMQNTTVSGNSEDLLVARVREINFPHEDLEEMEKAIDEGCERINPDDWR